MDVFQQAAQATWLSTWARIQAAAGGGRLAAERGDNRRATDGFTLAMELLPQVTPRYLERSDAEHWLSRFAGLASDAAACALNDGDVERAVTVLELGRGVLLADTIEARGDLAELRERAPGWADRFVQLNLELDATEDETSAFASAQPVFPGVAVTGDTRMNDRMSGFIGARRRELSDERDELIARIRTLSGHQRFLLPPTLSQLTSEAADGPIIMINISRIRCDAIILRPDDVLVDPLHDVTPDRLAERIRTFLTALEDIRSARFDIDRRERAEQVISQTLAWLRDAIAGPVLETLGLTSRNSATTQGWPKVWWSPAGLMSFLPIHAAGHHGDRASAGLRTALDCVVSSYTPTVRALAHLRRQLRAPRQEPRMLIVAVQHTPGQRDRTGTAREAELVKERFPGALVLREEQASRQRILDSLAVSTWAHFACHGYTNINDPARSAAHSPHRRRRDTDRARCLAASPDRRRTGLPVGLHHRAHPVRPRRRGGSHHYGLPAGRISSCHRDAMAHQ